ncbi:GNAT family N-acetyltransferase [Chitinophaga pollutisoli]|uniref:GNAT family N-acetyltransferase n=1 Tax=Chitinophaga pollutisoli TaxID=3133966 RepID=A0ABZ2YK08_9BACT
MKEEYIGLPLVKNETDHQFELTVEGHTAIIVYKESGSKIWLIHTEAPAELEGKGVATALIEKTLAYLEENHYTLVPLCPLVAAYLKRHPEWKRIVDPSVTHL